MTRLAWRFLRPFAILVIVLSRGAVPGQDAPQSHPYLRSGPSEKCVDVMFVPEGYTKDRSGKFLRDVDRYGSPKRHPLSEWK